MTRSLVQIYTGNGKGKTTAALGLAMRALGHAKKIYMLQFMKGSDKYGEIKAVRRLRPDFIIEQSGLDSFVSKDNPSEIDLKLAQKGFKRVREIVSQGAFDMVILDEINVAIEFGLISLTEVIELIKSRPLNVDLVLTGRYCPKQLYAYADLVSEIQEVKHHYQIGVDAREGIEY